jgi:streptogramin lyase
MSGSSAPKAKIARLTRAGILLGLALGLATACGGAKSGTAGSPDEEAAGRNNPPGGSGGMAAPEELATGGASTAGSGGMSGGSSSLSGAFTFFDLPVPDGDSRVGSITAGPDGNLWFTLGAVYGTTNAIGRVTPSGTVTEFPLEATPGIIVAGPDGNLWFTEEGVTAAGLIDYGVGRITPDGTMTAFNTPARPVDLIAGPDGNIWFTEYREPAAAVGSVTPTGVYSKVADGVSHSSSNRITANIDGIAWLTYDSGLKSITADGTVTAFPIDFQSLIGDFVAGTDGNLWLLELQHSIVRVTPAGVLTRFTNNSALGPGDGALGLTGGPGGDIWYTSYRSLGRLTPEDGKVVKFDGPALYGMKDAITTGPDGNIWFGAGKNVGKVAPPAIGRFTVP